ncbi:MAG: hypothetical protein IT287_09190 [Bdellovibrionaceae bacterium]|nr:hypothetical protein [Pseudobdellovibrionaceae bacterium]
MKKQFIILFSVTTFVALFVAITAHLLLQKEDSTQVVNGALISWINILFYSMIAGAVLSKKNIAWVLPMIVIKYVILVSVVYYIWASTDVALVLVGVFSELFLTALVLLPIRRFLVS